MNFDVIKLCIPVFIWFMLFTRYAVFVFLLDIESLKFFFLLLTEKKPVEIQKYAGLFLRDIKCINKDPGKQIILNFNS